jgi:hypothetical protein
MSEEKKDRFFDLAMKKIGGGASADELAKLEELLKNEPSLKDEQDRLVAECELLEESLLLVEATQEEEGTFPEWARPNLQREVKNVLGRPKVSIKHQSSFKFWLSGLFLAATCVVVFMAVLRLDMAPPSMNSDSEKLKSKVTIEAAIREAVGKPTGELEKTDFEMVKFLDLSELQVSDLTSLKVLTGLEKLILGKNDGLTELEIMNLKEALPNCEIQFEEK